MAGNNIFPIGSSATRPTKGGVASGDGGSHDGDMHERVAKLESDAEYIKRDIGELKTDVKAVLGRLSSIDSTLSGMNEKLDRFPTKLQLALWIMGGLATLLVGAAGLIAFLLKLSGHPDAADAVNSVRGK